MSDGITEARRGSYFNSSHKLMTEEDRKKDRELLYAHQLEIIPIEYIEKFLRKKKLENVTKHTK